jgi:hypothetical protein
MEVPNIKFHLNLSNGSRTDKRGQTDRWTDGSTDSLIMYQSKGALIRQNVAGNNKIYLGPYVKHPTFLNDSNQNLIFSKDFTNAHNITFCRNQSSGSRADRGGWTDVETDGRTLIR